MVRSLLGNCLGSFFAIALAATPALAQGERASGPGEVSGERPTYPSPAVETGATPAEVNGERATWEAPRQPTAAEERKIPQPTERNGARFSEDLKDTTRGDHGPGRGYRKAGSIRDTGTGGASDMGRAGSAPTPTATGRGGGTLPGSGTNDGRDTSSGLR